MQVVCRPKHLDVLNFVHSGSIIRNQDGHVRVGRQMAVAASQAVARNCTVSRRAEKTPSTCSTNQGNQDYGHLDNCDTRINKIYNDEMLRPMGHLHCISSECS